jgi:CubicO group peptidase (beta-lactamase class C family)
MRCKPKPTFVSAIIARLATVCVAVTACGVAPSAPDPVDRLFAAVNRPDSPGCAVAADLPTGPVRRTYGATDLERPSPITQDSIFEAGSVSKQFTAAAIALLATQHKLSLEDDVRKFVPELPDYGTPITIRELLEHTSGLRNWDDLVELEGWPRGTRLATQDGVLRLLARQRHLNFKPGSEFLYSNSNYVVAAIVTARASGRTFQTFSREALFAPIRMTSTRWRDDFTDIVPGRVRAFTPDDAGKWHLDMPFEDVVGAGGLLTTTGDMLRWNAALAHPSAEQLPWVTMLQRGGRLSDGTFTGYALGLELDTIAGVPAFSHAGATAGYRAYLALVPSQGVSVALLCNAGNLNTEDLGPKLTALFVRPASTPPAATALPDGGLAARVAGEYRIVETGVPIHVGAANNSISFGGSPLSYAANHIYRSAGGTRIATIDVQNGRVTSIGLRRTGNVPLVLRPVRRWNPSVRELQPFAGIYYSDELDARYIVQATPHGLSADGPNGAHFSLLAAYRSVFTDAENDWTVRFFSANGRGITTMSFTTTRARNVTFRKLSARV